MPRPIRVRGKVRPGEAAGLHLVSGAAAGLAQKAVLRSAMDPAESTVAVVFSVIAAEAFLADIVGLADLLRGCPGPCAPDVAAVLKYAEAPASTTSVQRFRDFAELLGANAAARERARWRDLEVLVALRNELVHYGPRRGEMRGQESGSIGDVLNHLRRRGIVDRAGRGRGRVRSEAVSIATTQAVASWAYQTARAAAGQLVDGVPGTPLVFMASMMLAAWDGKLRAR